jgi:uracil-DNA glycosylase
MLATDVAETIACCTRCALACGDVAPVPWKGPVPARVGVVAEAPGREENQRGRPLIGPAGRLLHTHLERVGLNPETMAMWNTVSCWPRRAPNEDEIRACAGNFQAQLELVNPSHVLILGGVALSVLRPGSKVMATRGKAWTVQNRTYFPTLHPSAILRNEGWSTMFEDDLAAFARLVLDGQ